MANVQETQEFVNFLGGVVDAGVDITADGKVDLNELLGKLNLFLQAQGAVQGIGSITGELAAASPEAKEDITAGFGSQLRSLKDEDAFDVKQLLGGLVSVVSLVTRKTADKIADGIERNGLPMQSMSDDSALTGADLLRNAR